MAKNVGQKRPRFLVINVIYSYLVFKSPDVDTALMKRQVRLKM